MAAVGFLAITARLEGLINSGGGHVGLPEFTDSGGKTWELGNY
jgi:hypothetical protein